MAQKAGNHADAIKHFRAYLRKFDPKWSGPVGSADRMRQKAGEEPANVGKHVLDARYRIGKSQLAQDKYHKARQNWENLLRILRKDPPPDQAGDPIDRRIGDTHWQVVRSYDMPKVAKDNVAEAIDAARQFLEAHRDHWYSVVAAWRIAETYQKHNRPTDAATAYEAFLAGKPYDLPTGERAEKPLYRFEKTPAALEATWKKKALFRLGEIRFSQQRYERAIKRWRTYVDRFPSGPQVSDARKRIIDAEFAVAVAALAEGKPDRARQRFRKFLEKHPLDDRAPRVLFTLGQMHAARADRLADEDAGKKKVREAYRAAIGQWEKLIGKHPDSDPAALALLRTGRLYDHVLGDPKKALETYRRVEGEPYAKRAKKRIQQLTEKQLHVRTEKKFRTDETPRIHARTRNIEKLTVRRYSLDLEAYFRKAHTIRNVESLDTTLIEPEKTREIEVEGYEKYAPIDQRIPVPFEGNQPGVCVVSVTGGDLRATTLVVRSDIDMVVRTSRRELLAFVEDMRKEKAVAGVKLLISDGKKVFATGTTGEDGVFRKKLDRLRSTVKVRVFAMRKGHVASNTLPTRGLDITEGLSARGYIYTARPAYQPGQTVKARGIIRNVKSGSYQTPAGETYQLQVTDPDGRTLHEQTVELSDFGTFHVRFDLPPEATTGRYTIRVQRTKEGGEAAKGKTYSSHFKVEAYQLKKLKLSIETPRKSYFPGETVKATITAEYQWGQPAAGQPVEYELPDGTIHTERTDSDGTVTVSYELPDVPRSGLSSRDHALTFKARIKGEDVSARERVELAQRGFDLDVEPAQDVVLTGEPFNVTVTATAPDGTPVEKKITLEVLRNKKVYARAVIREVPWIDPPVTAAAVTVAKRELATDPETGKATVQLSPPEGGTYILRAVGKDRADRTVSSSAHVEVSGPEDWTRLRFFVDSHTLNVGEETTVRLHSRLDKGLALLTWEGETILRHRVVRIEKGFNPIKIAVGHDLFPNFRLTASVMADGELHTARKDFRVERDLRVRIDPKKKAYAPGGEATVELTVTDQLGRPQKAELSLAMADEALFDRFLDALSIEKFFGGDRRRAEFRAVATNGFSYQAETRQVVEAVQEEAERLEREAKRKARRKELKSARSARAEMPSPSAAAQQARQSGGDAQRGSAGLFRDRQGEPAPKPRKVRPDAGHWIPSVVTDADGKATVTIPMPEKTTKWRLAARGVTVETAVGQATTKLVTRKDLFVTLKAPRSVVAGDQPRILARVHNTGDYQGSAELALTVGSGEKRLTQSTQTVELEPGRTAQATFDAFKVPSVAAEAGDHRDAVRRTLPVRPWGLTYADHGGGTAEGSAAVELDLPDGLKYTSRWLAVQVGPSVERAVLEMAKGSADGGPVPLKEGGHGPVAPRIVGPSTAAELLAAASGLGYARSVGAPEAEVARLDRKVRRLVGSLVASQKDGGGWGRYGGPADDKTTSTAYWALNRAKALGIDPNPDTLKKAENYLQKAFEQRDASDQPMKARILHALSTGDAATFELANPLYRRRQQLGTKGLAYTTALFANLGRQPIAEELAGILAAKSEKMQQGDRTLVYWPVDGDGQPDVHATALATLALVEANPASEKLRPAVEFLLQRRGVFGYGDPEARGPATVAVAGYFGQGQFAEGDLAVTVRVNGEAVQTVRRKGAPSPVAIDIPPARVREGKNTVRFEAQGRGTYAYAATLRGFSQAFKDPKSWERPAVRERHYYHERLRYRGRPIAAKSTSPVEHLALGAQTRVVVAFDRPKRRSGPLVVEEPLPAGATLVPGSLSGTFTHHEVRDGRIVMYYARDDELSDVTYKLAGVNPGTYHVGPTIIRDATDPSRMRIGEPRTLVVLGPGEESSDPYKMNDAERFALGKAHFDDGRYAKAKKRLSPLFDRENRPHEKAVARMLLWIHTTPDHYDARRVVETFEVLRLRYPKTTIPFDKTRAVARAYRDLGEHERAWLLHRATLASSFLADSKVASVLADGGHFLKSIGYQENLWWEYPDLPRVADSYFAQTQRLYQKAPEAEKLAERSHRAEIQLPAANDRFTAPKPTQPDMLAAAVDLLDHFVSMYPENPLADDAAFSMANALLDLKDYEAVVRHARVFRKRHPDSEFASQFRYMEALGHFWQRDYELAIAAAKAVAKGESEDRKLARYILGQIYHARGRPAKAIEWYKTVREEYPDAKQAIDHFQRERVALDEVTIVRPGRRVEMTLRHRNVQEARLQVYKVDLMKLYLRRKSLSDVTDVNLAGIAPRLVRTLDLADAAPFANHERKVELGLEEEGAYLVICRGDDRYTSGLVLITPLKLEVDTEPKSGRVRVNLINTVKDVRPAEVHVKAIGSAEQRFHSGETDLRGVFVADGLRGRVTVIARQGTSRYAFYRGKKVIGKPDQQAQTTQRQQRAKTPPRQVDYQSNLRKRNKALQQRGQQMWEQLQRSGQQGVEVDVKGQGRPRPERSREPRQKGQKAPKRGPRPPSAGKGGSGPKAPSGQVRVTDNDASDLPVQQPKMVDGVARITITGEGTLQASGFYYNIRTIHVRPGQKVRLTFKNVGKMPKAAGGHQFILLRKSARITTFVTQATNAGLSKDYIPQKEEARKKMLAHTALLGPGEAETITFTAPESTGTYPFLCAFPGHFATMKGKLIVEDDSTSGSSKRSDGAPSDGAGEK